MCGEVDVSHLTKALSSYSKVFIKVCDEKNMEKISLARENFVQDFLIHNRRFIVFKIIRGVWHFFPFQTTLATLLTEGLYINIFF